MCGAESHSGQGEHNRSSASMCLPGLPHLLCHQCQRRCDCHTDHAGTKPDHADQQIMQMQNLIMQSMQIQNLIMQIMQVLNLIMQTMQILNLIMQSLQIQNLIMQIMQVLNLRVILGFGMDGVMRLESHAHVHVCGVGLLYCPVCECVCASASTCMTNFMSVS